MPVYRRGKVWYADVQLGGRRIRRRAGTRREALNLEAAIRNRILAHAAGEYRLDEALAKWLDGDAKRLKSHAKIIEHARQIAPYCDRFLRNAPDAAEAYKRDHPHLSAATVNRRIALLRRVTRLAFSEWGWLDAAVHQRIKLLPEKNRRGTFLTPKQVHMIAALVTQEGVRDAIYLSVYSGCRLGELCALRAEDRREGTLYIGDSKSGRPRSVPLPPVVQQIRLPIRATRYQCQDNWRSATKKLGIRARWHDLRHTYASWLIQKGARLQTVRDLLGHSTISITADLYGHLEQSHLRDAVDLLDTNEAQG